MEQNPSWEDDIRTAGQESTRLLRHLKAHYRVHNSSLHDENELRNSKDVRDGPTVNRRFKCMEFTHGSRVKT
jgi:hypothetical protein